MKYDALIFDMDGTIVHNMPTHNQAWSETLAEAGVQIDLDEFYRTTTGKKTAEILRMMLGHDLGAEELEWWGNRKEALYRERYASRREPMPGLVALLEQAHTLGLTLAVATAAPPENITFILDDLDLRRHFNAVVGAEDVTKGKPDPEIFLKAAKTLGVEPSHCLVFEDALAGIEGARRAGMDVVMLCTTLEAHETASEPHILCAVSDYTQINLRTLLE